MFLQVIPQQENAVLHDHGGTLPDPVLLYSITSGGVLSILTRQIGFAFPAGCVPPVPDEIGRDSGSRDGEADRGEVGKGKVRGFQGEAAGRGIAEAVDGGGMRRFRKFTEIFRNL